MKKWFRKMVSFCLILALAAACVPASVQAEGLESFVVGEFKEDVEVPSDKSGMIYRFIPDETQTYAFVGKVYSNTYLELSVLVAMKKLLVSPMMNQKGIRLYVSLRQRRGKNIF